MSEKRDLQQVLDLLAKLQDSADVPNVDWLLSTLRLLVANGVVSAVEKGDQKSALCLAKILVRMLTEET